MTQDSSHNHLARSAARLAAVQALYQIEMLAQPPQQTVSEFHTYRLGACMGEEVNWAAEMEGEFPCVPDGDFFDEIVYGVAERSDEIDTLICAHLAKGWSLDRLDRPLRQILRAGVYELLARDDVSSATIINEYINLAHAFASEKETGFVNGLLDHVAHKVRPKSAG